MSGKDVMDALMTGGDPVAEVLYGRDIGNQGLLSFIQAMHRGRIDKEEALSIIESSPRLAEALMSGLSVSGYGDVTPRRFIELASNGSLVSGLISRALSA